MGPLDLAAIIVSLVAALSAWASQRAASKATVVNNNTNSRVEMEKDAYTRARTYDTETIRRQDTEMEELRSENKELIAEIKRLNRRVARLERELHPRTIEEERDDNKI